MVPIPVLSGSPFRLTCFFEPSICDPSPSPFQHPLPSTTSSDRSVAFDNHQVFVLKMKMTNGKVARLQRCVNPVTESAGINRHIVGDVRALRRRRSDSILASSLACDLARDHSEA